MFLPLRMPHAGMLHHKGRGKPFDIGTFGAVTVWEEEQSPLISRRPLVGRGEGVNLSANIGPVA